MSDFELLQTTATEVQQQLAQMMGMEAGAAGNALYNGALLKGVWGHPRPVEIMNPAGGFRKLTLIDYTVTRDQFTPPSAPLSQTVIMRTDITPSPTYEVAMVDTHDPLIYVLTARIVGPKPITQRP